MANPNRGEVELKAGEETYTLVFDINAVCELEQMLDKGVNEIVVQMGRVSVLRAMLWAGLRHNHKVTIEQAGEIMQMAGAAETAAMIQKATELAFPPKDSTKNPQ